MGELFGPSRANFLKVSLIVAAAVLVVCLLAVAVQRPAKASYPGQNGKLAFVAYFTDGYQIWTMDADGTNQTPVYTANGVRPVWSPDGTQIAFQSDRDGDWDIYTMNADGSDLVRLTDSPHADVDPTWSPDGTRIAFVRSQTTWYDGTIHVMDADGSDAATLNFDPGHINGNPTWWRPSGLAWSPDGTKIAFAFHHDCPECGYQIFPDLATVDVDGSDFHFVKVDDENQSSIGSDPSWSPDGTKIAYVYPWGDYTQVVSVVNADGSNDRVLTTLNVDDGSEGFVGAAWAPDGKSVAAVGGFGGEAWSVYRYAPDGSDHALLAPDYFGTGDIDWQPIPKPAEPTSKAECKKGGYEEFGFENQGLCVASVQSNANSSQ